MRKRSGNNKCFFCAKAKRQQQMFFLCESEASATNVLSLRKRSGSNKAPSRNGNPPRSAERQNLYHKNKKDVSHNRNTPFYHYLLTGRSFPILKT
ncbi:hypothetical protein [Lysinibacillus sp. NPDC056232]|uniref:hypothetical protein n=1 Tax=Lysinibacillus sp. NPDC056232 TaxID=3345756 RepID=UPI0035D72E94